MSDLSVRNLHKSFGSFHAVKDVSFDLAHGEIVSLLGASGCGKTTLLRLISGLVTPDAGAINLADRKVYDSGDRTNIPVEKRNMGFVFQSYAIWPHLKVWENVAYGLRVQKLPKAQAKETVYRMLKIVGLDHLGDRYPSTLSGGQQQRVALARGLVIKPKLLLLDEPLSNLDLRVREQMREYIRELIKELGVSAIFVTHDYAEALVLSDRVLVMDAGQIVEQSSPQTIYNAPTKRASALIVGRANVMTITGISDSDLRIASVIAGNAETDLTDITAQYAIVRPEEILIDTPSSPDDIQVPGVIETRYYLGPTTDYVVSTRLGPFRIESRDHHLATNDTVTLHVPKASIKRMT